MTSLCRLCSTTENLVSMYDYRLEKKNTDMLRFSIQLATGIDIREDDIVSKMVCHRCCEIAVKLHKYRANAVANDKLLKEQCGQPYVPPATDQDELRRLSTQILTSNGRVVATPLNSFPFDGKLSSLDTKNTASHEALQLLSGVTIKPEPVDEIIRKPEPYKHKSVKDLFKKYPGIILPEPVFKCDIAPVVTLDQSEVEEWAEEEFKRVQQKLSWAKIIIQKVGENSHIDKNSAIISTNGSLPTKKRPGPKSKTLDLLVSDECTSAVFKVKEHPKPTTVNFVPKDSVNLNMGVVYNKPMPQSKKQEITASIMYRPGPKSRKPDLIINSTKPKLIVHESHSLKTTETPTCKLNKLLERKGNSDKQDIKAVDTTKSPTVVSNTSNQAAVLESDDDNDFDFEPGTVSMDDYSDESDDDFGKIRNTRGGTNHAKKEMHTRRSAKSSLFGSGNDSSSDFLDTSKRHSLRKSDTNRHKKDKRSLRSAKRCSSVDSSKSDEPPKKKVLFNSKNETEPPKNKSTPTESTSKIESNAAKPDTQKTDVRKVDGQKNKGALSKKRKSDAKSTSSNKELKNLVSTDKKEASKVNDKKTVVSIKESPNLMGGDKKDPSKVTVNNQPTSNGSTVLQKAKTLTSDAPSLLIGRAQKIYMCHMCCKLFDSGKELSDHQKAHLTCQFCHYKMKNLDTLKKHQEENCRMNVKKKKNEEPTLKLTKVDSIQSIVNKYPDAFSVDDNAKQNDVAAAVAKQDDHSNVIHDPPPPLVTKIKPEIVCISDESDNEVECVKSSSGLNIFPESLLDLPLSGMTENDMIQALFTKHLKTGISKFQRAAQTFVPSSSDIRYTSSNLIVLENLFNELYTYKIPVQLEIRPKISARFTGKVVPPPRANLECWAHLKAINIRKPVNKSKPVRIAPAKFQSPTAPTQTPLSILPKAPSQAVPCTPPATDTNTIILNNLLNTSPAVPTSAPVITNSNLFLTANNSFIPALNDVDKSPPSFLSFLSSNSSASPSNMTTTLIQTSNNSTLFMQNGVASNHTTIIQTPNNATLIQTPNAAVIQTGNSTSFITPDLASGIAERNLLQASSSVTTNSDTAQNSVVLMHTVPQLPAQQTIINNQSAVSTVTSNNLLFQTPSEQIYQINNAMSNVNKVVVFSNTLSNGLQQNMPLYATPYLSNLPSPNFEPSSVQIEEIEENPPDKGSVTDVATINHNKTTLRIKPSWELY